MDSFNLYFGHPCHSDSSPVCDFKVIRVSYFVLFVSFHLWLDRTYSHVHNSTTPRRAMRTLSKSITSLLHIPRTLWISVFIIYSSVLLILHTAQHSAILVLYSTVYRLYSIVYITHNGSQCFRDADMCSGTHSHCITSLYSMCVQCAHVFSWTVGRLRQTETHRLFVVTHIGHRDSQATLH